MQNNIHLKVITHQKVVFEDDIKELYVKTTDGSMGILKDHIPMVAALEVGVAKIVKDNSCQCIAIMGGILQFSSNNATILTDVAELDCDIDIARAKQARERAQARLNAKDDNIDMARAQVALAKAIARISARSENY